jgi:hypothetical protein
MHFLKRLRAAEVLGRIATGPCYPGGSSLSRSGLAGRTFSGNLTEKNNLPIVDRMVYKKTIIIYTVKD